MRPWWNIILKESGKKLCVVECDSCGYQSSNITYEPSAYSACPICRYTGNMHKKVSTSTGDFITDATNEELASFMFKYIRIRRKSGKPQKFTWVPIPLITSEMMAEEGVVGVMQHINPFEEL